MEKIPKKERKQKITPKRGIPQIFNREDNRRSGDIGSRALQRSVNHCRGALNLKSTLWI
jgi:hypothetical protein